MGLSAYVGSLTQPAATGNQSITGVGFQPKLIIFFYNDLTSSTVTNTILREGYGAATSSSARWVNCGYTPSASTSQYVSFRNDACIDYVNSGLGTDGRADLVSLDADGFTINWSTTDATARLVNFIAFAGSDITNVKVGTFTTSTTTGNQGITGIGFQPDSIIFPSLYGSTTALSNAVNTANRNSIGFGISSSNRGFSVSRNQNNGSTEFAGRYQRTDKIWALFSGTSAALVTEGDLVSMDSDGFTINWTTNSGSARINFYVAIKGGQFKIGTFNQSTSTGNQTVTGVGFQPSGVILSSVNAASSSSLQTPKRFSFGAASSSSARAAIWNGVADGGTTSLVSQSLNQAKVLEMLTESTPTLTTSADFVSNNSDGFTINNTTTDATAREVLYFAFGSIAAQSTVKQLAALGAG